MMTPKELKPDSWIWAVVQNPGKDESFLCQYDEPNDIRFIPAFYDKDSALRCIALLKKDKAQEFEPHAIILEDLVSYTRKNGFVIFILDKDGTVVDKLASIPEK
jgi:hypothetical protein